MSPDARAAALRRALLAAVLTASDSLADVEVRDDAVVHEAEGLEPLRLPWGELVLAAGDAGLHPGREDAAVRRRLARWIRLRILLHAHLGEGCPDGPEAGRAWVLSRVRPRCLPVEHALHPGEAWPLRQVMGGALDLGLALRGYDDDARPDPDAVGLLPAGVLVAACVPLRDADERARRYLSDMAALAADRMRRDPTAVLRPLGDADVVTLLASPEFRTALVDGQGMRSAAIPSRHRGWLDLGRLDPAFAVTAAELTDPDERGFTRPVLVTVDEVTQVRPGGEIVRQVLADPAPQEPARPAEPRLA
ncbi:MAG TPA: hypothetical protein VFL59_07515 [Candidatus Nanopelagicales bacterium]|nr:hypothetical protein [Candidatus Nanopelagicales bacterium]